MVCGLKLADPGITTEPRGLTASQSRPADIFTTAAVLGRSASLDVCVASSKEETPRRRRLIANYHTTETKFRNYATRAFTNDLSYGQQTGDQTQPSLQHCSVQQTSHPARMALRCRRNRFNTDGNTKFKLLFFAGEQFCRTRRHAQSGSSPVSLIQPFIIGTTSTQPLLLKPFFCKC